MNVTERLWRLPYRYIDDDIGLLRFRNHHLFLAN